MQGRRGHCLTHEIDLILKSTSMSDEWRNSALVPIHKDKEMFKIVIIEGLRLMSHMMKLGESVVEQTFQGEKLRSLKTNLVISLVGH